MTDIINDGELELSEPIVNIDRDTGEIVPVGSTPQELRAWLISVTRKLLALPKSEQREFDVRHTFLDGIYMRELFIPKGSLLVGKVHRLHCLNVVSKGDISVVTESGSARVKAGYSVASPAGLQKLGYAHEDTVFVNVFRTDETDPEKIEDVIAFSDFVAAGLEANEVILCL